jgi:hypothetical protein
MNGALWDKKVTMKIEQNIYITLSNTVCLLYGSEAIYLKNANKNCWQWKWGLCNQRSGNERQNSK